MVSKWERLSEVTGPSHSRPDAAAAFPVHVPGQVEAGVPAPARASPSRAHDVPAARRACPGTRTVRRAILNDLTSDLKPHRYPEGLPGLAARDC
jgi:hypothetical protein